MWRIFLIALALVAFPLQYVLARAPVDHEGARAAALLIGNGSYPDAPLANPPRDVRAMAAALQARGFEVTVHEDLDRHGMLEAVRSFGARHRDAGTRIVYFSGHGFFSGGATWLAPVNAGSREPSGLLRQALDLQTLLDALPAAVQGSNLILLDACRNDPFAGGSGPDRLLRIPPGSVIGYAATPGAHAADGGRHGVFTGALLQALRDPDVRSVEALLAGAAAAVLSRTSGHQAPAVTFSTSREAFLPPLASAPPGLEQDDGRLDLRSRAILPKNTDEQYELTFWESIKDSNHIGDYEAYLQAYPKGRFAALARARIERLKTASRPEAAPAETRPAPAAKTPPPPPEKKPPPPRTAAPPAKEPPPAPPKQAPAAVAPPPAEPVPDKPPPKAAAGEIRDCPACPVLVSLPAGSFTMGSNSGDPTERPAHRVNISAPFAIGKYEVTVDQWNACAEAGGCPKLTGAGAGNTPARDVSWEDAQAYVKWLSATTGKKYRLPSEAEWEYAARGGTASRFWWGEQMRPGNANCKECGDPWSADGPARSGSFAPNPYGLHDVNGSVWEWVADCWHNSFKGAPGDGRPWDLPGCRDRVIRGGSWRDGAGYMPSSTRFKYGGSVRQSQNGFRVAREMK